MFSKLALLILALMLAIPAFADTASNPAATNATTPPHKHKNKDKDSIEINSFSQGVTSPADQAIKKPVPKNQAVKDPCKGPNPPHDCKQVRPHH